MKLKGIYLVIDPSIKRDKLLAKTRKALDNGTRVLQVWNNWPEHSTPGQKRKMIQPILALAAEYDVPVLVNEEWQLLKTTALHGVHFDTVPNHFDNIRKEIGRDFICGITCSNDLGVIEWADENRLDYISFCAMFPSPSVDNCPIVRPETVQKAREITSLPLFLSGGITPDNLGTLDNLDFDGVAVISGILKSDNPGKAASEIQQALNKKTAKS